MLSRAVRTVVLTPPWWFRGSALDLDFLQNRAAVNSASNGSAVGQLTLTRATSGYAQWASGQWTSFASGAFRQTDKGLLIEEARTNDALWSRDMTNVVWVKTNVTAAQTAVGADGAANSATQLTATAGNATVLQTIALGSSADTYSAIIQRVSGSGNIQITADGVTYTTVALTGGYAQFQVTQTLANPVFGIRIVTSGDVINVDFSQLEPGGFATSPIATTSAAVTRNADAVTVTGTAVAPSVGTALSITQLPFASVSFSKRCIVWSIGADASNNNRLGVKAADTAATSIPAMVVGTGSSVVMLSDITVNAGTVEKLSGAWDASSSSFAMQGRAAVTNASGWNAQTLPFSLGADSNIQSVLSGYIQRFAVWNSKLSGAQLTSLTQ